MRRPETAFVAALLLIGAVGWGSGGTRPPADSFDHKKHEKLFPLCTTCHTGAATEGAALWPSPVQCQACHDGQTERRIDWAPPASMHPSNLRFTHTSHAQRAATPPAGRKAATACQDCHVDPGASRMSVRRPVATQCLTCHTLPSGHVTAPDSACAQCHFPLVEATALTTERIKGFKAPPNHSQTGFLKRGPGGHGELAKRATGTTGIAASCATCHARDFCAQCHVDAPERAQIQALAVDPRSRAIEAHPTKPATHETGDWLERHRLEARSDPTTCATCHTRESCLACHVTPYPAAIARLPEPGPGRAPGAVVTRRPPASHAVVKFTESHGPEAAASPSRCMTCHTRNECLSCHLPQASGGRQQASSTALSGGSGARSDFHPAGFLTKHPAEAFRRATTCADCHQPGQFCATCHLQSGVTSSGLLGTTKYHDAQSAFAVAHGPAARRSLESCVTCHVERDCLTCHSAIGGRRFSPHGPGFDAERLKRKNPEACFACHGRAIPN